MAASFTSNGNWLCLWCKSTSDSNKRLHWFSISDTSSNTISLKRFQKATIRRSQRSPDLPEVLSAFHQEPLFAATDAHGRAFLIREDGPDRAEELFEPLEGVIAGAALPEDNAMILLRKFRGISNPMINIASLSYDSQTINISLREWSALDRPFDAYNCGLAATIGAQTLYLLTTYADGYVVRNHLSVLREQKIPVHGHFNETDVRPEDDEKLSAAESLSESNGSKPSINIGQGPDSGYQRSLQDNPFSSAAGSPSSSAVHVTELQQLKRFMQSHFSESGVDPEDEEMPKESSLDDNVRSVVSAKADISSHEPRRRTVQEITAEDELVIWLVQNKELRPLYVEALNKLAEVGFIDSYQRLLKQFYLDLSRNEETNLEQATFNLLKNRRNRIRIAQRIFTQLRPDSEEVLVQVEQQVRETEDRMPRAGSRIAGNAEIVPLNDLPEPTIIDKNSDQESHLSKDEAAGEEIPKVTVAQPNATEMEDFLLKRNSFQLPIFDLPPSLAPLTRILMSIPSDRIWFSTEEDLSFSNKMKAFMEDHSQGIWNWWPLRSRMRMLERNQTRLHWRCVSPIPPIS